MGGNRQQDGEKKDDRIIFITFAKTVYTMDIYFPYQESIKCAAAFSAADLKLQIKACKDRLRKNYDEWLDRHRICLEEYDSGNIERASWWSNHALAVLPEWIDDERCLEDRKAMNKRFPRKYPMNEF